MNYTCVVYEPGHNDNLLETGEKYKVTVNLTGLGVPASQLPMVNEKFKLEVKPPEGAVLAITRTLPPALAANSFYPVY